MTLLTAKIAAEPSACLNPACGKLTTNRVQFDLDEQPAPFCGNLCAMQVWLVGSVRSFVAQPYTPPARIVPMTPIERRRRLSITGAIKADGSTEDLL